MNLIVWSCLMLISRTCHSLQTDTASTFRSVADEPLEGKRGHIPSFPRVIRGTITDGDGNPVPEALIEWWPDFPDKASRESTRSEDDGSY